MDGEVVNFDSVYVGDRGHRSRHLHAVGMCGHSGDLTTATQDELYSLECCGQCLNRAEELGLLVTPNKPPDACPTCFLVGPCDCEN